MEIKKDKKQLCLACYNDCEPESLFWVENKEKTAKRLYCSRCIKLLKMKIDHPYVKPRKKKEK